MQKLMLCLFLLSCWSYQSFAHDHGKHIHVVVKTGDKFDLEECYYPNSYGKIQLTATNIEVRVYNYSDAIAIGCGYVKLVARNPLNPSQEYNSITLDPTTMGTWIPNPDPASECPGYYSFTPNLTYWIPAACEEEGGLTSVSVEYALIFSADDTCTELLFPDACFGEDGHTHDLNHLSAVRDTLEVNCCATIYTGPGFDNPFNPRKEEVDISFDLSVSPNPFYQNLQVTLDATTDGTAQFELYDSNNRRVFHQTEAQAIGNNRYLLQTANLANGFYYLRVQSGEEVAIKKIIKIQ